MSKINRKVILKAITPLFAEEGIGNISIRKLAKKLDVSPSALYYHYKDEEELLLDMFNHLNTQLGEDRAKLPELKTANEMLKQRIAFQIDHQQSIVAVLKYFISFRKRFPKIKSGFVPEKSTLHIKEVLLLGQETGEFSLENIEEDAKVITHAINGFLLEYYPHMPTGKEKELLIEGIHSFLMRALENKKKL